MVTAVVPKGEGGESTPAPVPTPTTSVVTGGNSSLDDVKLGEFKKFVDIQDKLDRLNERRSSGQMTIGQRFEEGLNQHFTNELMGKFFGNMTGGVAAVKKHDGITGIIMEIFDTKMGYALGEQLGKSAPQLIQMLGSGKVNEIIDAYKKSSDPNYVPPQVEESQEDRQKKQNEYIISINPNDPVQLQQFMQAVNLTDINAAKTLLIGEQQRIMKERGVMSQVQEGPKDINRQLMQQYDDPQRIHPQQTFSGNSNDVFFSSQPAPQSQVNNEQFIMSLNPDDPISQQQYQSARGMSGVPIDEVKRMMIKEQRSLKPAPSPVESEIDSKWTSHDDEKQEVISVPKADPLNTILELLSNIGERLTKLEKREGIEVIQEPPTHLHDSTNSSHVDEPSSDQSHIITSDGGYPHPLKDSLASTSTVDESQESPENGSPHSSSLENSESAIKVVDEIKAENVVSDDIDVNIKEEPIRKIKFKIKRNNEVQ